MTTTMIEHQTKLALFKKYDYRISLFLIITSPFILLITARIGAVLYAYFIVGGWHIISMITHFTYTVIYKRRKLSKNRSIYHWLIVLFVVMVIIRPLYTLLFLLFAAPFMAIWYTVLCYNEVTKQA